ncbi:hypothetical protein Taro_011611 [Colocasia esculenta]|uniref:Uncharacterized protein n=1 Tax=Colocasia esculenta TaxID=4460 RepID=A0A843U6S3_COLES|nr:hypothetical protein [Colocasia esculenta]
MEVQTSSAMPSSLPGGKANLILHNTPSRSEVLLDIPHPALCQQWLTLPLRRGWSNPLDLLHDGRTTMAMLLGNWSWSLSLNLSLLQQAI